MIEAWASYCTYIKLSRLGNLKSRFFGNFGINPVHCTFFGVKHLLMRVPIFRCSNLEVLMKLSLVPKYTILDAVTLAGIV